MVNQAERSKVRIQKFLQARPDLIEEWEAGAAAAELSPTSASRAHGGTRAARGRGGGSNAAEPPTPSDVQMMATEKNQKMLANAQKSDVSLKI